MKLMRIIGIILVFSIVRITYAEDHRSGQGRFMGTAKMTSSSNHENHGQQHNRHNRNRAIYFPYVYYYPYYPYYSDYTPAPTSTPYDSYPSGMNNNPSLNGNWVDVSNDQIPANAIVYARDQNNNAIYYCRGTFDNNVYYGTVTLNSACIVINNSMSIRFNQYQVLVP